MTPTPSPLWVPPDDRRARSHLQSFLADHGFDDYEEGWRWSVAPATTGDFWDDAVRRYGLRWSRVPESVLEPGEGAWGARWFRGGLLNYAEHALAPPALEGRRGRRPAVVARSQTRPPLELSWDQLESSVARVAAGLRSAGVRRGDRVAACLPNVPETLIAMLASASLGAVFTSCAPESGVAATLDRLSQVAPTVLLHVDGYRYGRREVDRRAEAEAVLAGLPSVRRAVWLDYLRPGTTPPVGWATWDELTASQAPLEHEPVAFDHPLYVLYSSGTTGRPKAIVHGHGGILVEHAKVLTQHFDLGPDDRLFWYSTTGWMMWNFCVSGLLTGSTVVLFDGNPTWPEPDALFEVMASTGVTCGGVGAGYLVVSMRADLRPKEHHDLGALHTLGSTGSPLPAAAARWTYGAVADDLLLASFSGGTDVCTGFLGGSPLHPVWAGEISCRCLGAPVAVVDDAGRPLVGSEGELVLTGPMPSMPVGFWGDADGSRYRNAYFETFPGVWAHGDRAVLTERGSVVVSGRSDGTLNRGGVRMGTAELYSVVEANSAVEDSLVVHLDDQEGGPGEIWLFVVEREGTDHEELVGRLRSALGSDLSPRHVPDRILAVPAVPRTLTGKKLEVPVKRILSGTPIQEALALTAVADPASLEPYESLARQRGAADPTKPSERRQ
ncbi:MAG TPA: acetoacetate--CoA ligase [Acidimicrobiales bacterium]|nr:acetoacetate--CoA ligase [Acidimicrobiales bacterium]